MALTSYSYHILRRSPSLSLARPISAITTTRSESSSFRFLSAPPRQARCDVLGSPSALSLKGACWETAKSSSAPRRIRRPDTQPGIPSLTALGAESPQGRQFSASRVVAMAGSNEEAAAKAASAAADTGNPTIFDKIVRKEIPANIVYEDDEVLAFRDISPQAPVHIILIPKNRDGLTQLCKAEERHAAILGRLLLAARQVAISEGLVPNGYRLVINDGPDGCQSVYHLHIHILGGRQMKWPPG
ncbi:hypothetical protein CLOM_g10153 [Closterium sp. NIES-68]|nr:hypothetical protein CLOM_g10153 [Closterium sp. NIES-68]GJP83622.1 hypothetical protein CLOP_g13750 [Closterium sp. NIES-67]